MKVIWIVGGIVLGLPLLVGGFGLLLPRDHVATRTARFGKPPAEVFGVVSDFANAAAWRKDVKSIEMLPLREGRVAFKEASGNGTMTLEVTEIRLVTRIDDAGMPFGGRWVYAFLPDGDGCRLSITEEGFVRNPIFRVLARYVFGYTSMLDRYLISLGARLGETVTPS